MCERDNNTEISSDVVVLERLVGQSVPGVTGEQPQQRMASSTHLRQQSHAGPPRPEGSLLLGLLHQSLVGEYGLELITGDSDDKHSEQDGLHDK